MTSRLETSVWLPHAIRPVFAYFADPRHLNETTPPWFHLDFEQALPELASGVTISYRLRYRLLSLAWTSRIVAWEPPTFFAYEQERGPYRSFLHEHRFAELSGGTTMTDRVIYRAPLHRLTQPWVERDLEAIFRYRRSVARRLFGGPAAPLEAPIESALSSHLLARKGSADE